jgi:hypothetical protein
MPSKRKETQITDEGDDTGKGGKSGSVEFRDFLNSGENLRDDLLPVDAVKRLLSVHQETSEVRVKKQKELRDQRAQLRNGKLGLQEYRQGLQGGGMESSYKVHPVFAKSPQFHDARVNALPTENVTQTNDELKNELKNEYQLKYNPQYIPQFNPKLTR